jgi:Phosphopantetheine attachment site
MTRDELSSIDLVEVIMAIEESFEVEIPDHDAEAISGPREIVNWLAVHLAGRAMSDGAVLQLENLARQRRMPHLMQNFNRTWQPEQINAIVWEILRLGNGQLQEMP